MAADGRARFRRKSNITLCRCTRIGRHLLDSEDAILKDGATKATGALSDQRRRVAAQLRKGLSAGGI